MSFVLAHAAPISYRFPLPIWLAFLGGGLAVLLSAPAAALAARGHEPGERRRDDLYPLVRRLRLGPIVTTAGSALIVVAFAGGLFGNGVEWTQFYENPMTVLTWIDFWVGLGILSWLIGGFWERVSPLNIAGRAVDRVRARRGVRVLRYPARLGQWPAVLLLVVWSWMELVWSEAKDATTVTLEGAKDPRNLALIMLAYVVATLVGCALFGARAWLGNVELFSVLARTLSRFSPLELRPFVPEEWAASPPDERSVRLRWYGAGLRSDPALPAGGAAFVLTLLATVVFDGWLQTNRFESFEQWFFDRWPSLTEHVTTLRSVTLFVVVVVFITAYAVVAGRQGAAVASALIPIAAVFFTAHNLSYLLIASQDTLPVLIDPFGHRWWLWAEYASWTGIAPHRLIWWIQALLLAGGYSAAVFAVFRFPGRRAPLVGLMAAYTVVGLVILTLQVRV